MEVQAQNGGVVENSRFVIVGGGMVAGYAAKQFVELGLKPGEVTILSSEGEIPYERPPLSKGLLQGKDDEASIRINPEPFYREHGIALKLGQGVKSIDTKSRRLTLDGGGEFGYENLILATGCRARTLSVPGSQLGNVCYLRSLADSVSIRQKAAGAKRAVVLGGGFIGMEVASGLTQMGVETTMAMPEERVWKRFFTPEMSKFFEGYYTERGVKFAHGATVTEFRGEGSVREAVFGSRTIECDLVVAGIGAQPVTEFLTGSGIEVNNGVVVNEFLETGVPGVFAAGDIANYPDLLFDKRRRVEHWDNAVSQGQHCARVLMGDRAPFKHVPYFFSDVFDLSYELWGDTSGADRVEYRGDVTTKSFSVWWQKGGNLVAAFCMNRPDEERESAPKLIEARQPLDAKM
jgi:NADPH-dependent 2,4-dienoyl-CoA reductase/sulfur reductase-like enzyme